MQNLTWSLRRGRPLCAALALAAASFLTPHARGDCKHCFRKPTSTGVLAPNTCFGYFPTQWHQCCTGGPMAGMPMPAGQPMPPGGPAQPLPAPNPMTTPPPAAPPTQLPAGVNPAEPKPGPSTKVRLYPLTQTSGRSAPAPR